MRDNQLSGKTMKPRDGGLQERAGRFGNGDGDGQRPVPDQRLRAAVQRPAADGLPTLKVFTRVQASNPSTISCANPSTNTQGNATVLLNGVLKNATGPTARSWTSTTSPSRRRSR